MKALFALMILVAGILLPAAAQETVPDQGNDQTETLVLDLQAAVDHAITYNKSLQNARMEVEKSAASVWESIAQGLPQVDGTLDYMTYFNYEMTFSFGTDGGSDITPEMIMEAANQTLNSGYFPGTTMQDLNNHQAGNYMDQILQGMLPESSILLRDASTAKLQVSQLIFSGQYIAGIQAAKLAKIISEQSLEYNEQGIKESVIMAYYLVLITQESLDILEQNVENLEETLAQTEVMYQTGMAEQTDVDQIRITVNQLQNSRNALARNQELNYNMLRFQLGVETNRELILTDKLESLFSAMNPQRTLATPFSMEENLGFQLAKSSEDINEKLLSLERWNYAPTLAGFYNYNAKILTTNFDMNPNHLAGFQMSIPIFSSGMRKARVDQARINYNQARNERSIVEDQLSLQEKQFRYNLQSALENYETQKENVDVAMRVYDSFRRKYEQGMASSLDLTQANGNYLEAESNYMSSMMEVMNAKLQLDKLMNKL